ncbi:MAG: DNA polymerase III subunit psi [Chitinophagaceae bacterium]|nr:DNA polymerase III subunit psi [Chitinophagaceae bacterium]
MDELNKISLDNGMLAMLYRDSLVNIGNQKVMVVVKGKLTQEQNDFLMQILNACRLSAGQVSIVNTAEVVIEKAVAELSPRYILSFGMGSGKELFFMENSGGTRFLNAPGLEEMMRSSELKRKTWGELKVLFGLQTA